MKKHVFKRISSALLAVVMTLSMALTAALPLAAETLSGECGASGSSVTWVFDPETGTITIGGTGKMADFSPHYEPWKSNRESIKRVVVEEGVTGIGRYAFYSYPNIVSVTLPSTLTGGYQSIGAYAFEYCYKIVEVINYSTLPLAIGNSNYGYVSYYAKEIHTGESRIVSDGDFVFYCGENENYLLSYTGSQTQLTLPESCNGEDYKISDRAFYNCTTLKSVTLPQAVTEICKYAFCGCSSLESINIPDTVKGIGDNAFYGCSSLKSISIPSGVTSIGDYAFYGCTALASNITIPNGVTSIGTYTFYNCESLSGVSLHSAVTEIATYAFYGCKALDSIKIPDSVTIIEKYAFTGCDGIIDKENGIYYVDKWIIDSDTDVTGEDMRPDTVGIANSSFGNRENILLLVLPDSLKYIGESAFYSCDNMMSVTIPEAATKINNHAFAYCDKLMEIVNNSSLSVNVGSVSHGHLAYSAMEVHSGESKMKRSGDYLFYNFEDVNYMVEYLGSATEITLPLSYDGGNYELYGTFSGKTNITSVIIPSGMKNIGGGAFSGCTGLTSIEIPNSVTSIEGSAFAKCSSLKSVTIPSSVESIGDSAFSNCTSLESVTVVNNSNLKSIGKESFNECSNLTSVVFGTNSKLESIGLRAFYNCKLLADIDLPESLIRVEENAFSFCSDLIKSENGVKYVDTWVISPDKTYFSGSSSWDIVLRDGTVGIADYAFGYYDYVKTVELPSTLEIIGIGAFASEKLIETLTIPDNVVSIGDYAFKDCKGLTSVTIGNNSKLTNIGTQAFASCVKLEGINIPKGVTNLGDRAFISCKSLTGIVIPDGITSIGEYMFSDCQKLSSVTIPESVISIGKYAFRACYALETIHLPKNVTEVGDHAVQDCSCLKQINIPVTVDSINEWELPSCSSLETIIYCGTESEWEKVEKPSYWSNFENITLMFHNYVDGNCTECGLAGETSPEGDGESDKISWTLDTKTHVLTISGKGPMENYASYDAMPWYSERYSITDIVIEEGITSIGDYAFYECLNLKNISISSTVESIGSHSFAYCRDIQLVEIPGNVKTIGNNAFNNCESLLVLTLKDGVEVVGNGAFMNCEDLQVVVMADSVTDLGFYAFADCPFLHTINISQNVTALKNGLFYGCVALKSITVPNNVTSIGNEVFYNCTALETITLPDSVKSIGDSAFYACDALTEVNFPKNLESVGASAFEKCIHLAEVHMFSSITSIGDKAFYDCNELSTVVYCGSEDEWNSLSKGSDWNGSDWGSATPATIQFHDRVDNVCKFCGDVYKDWELDEFGNCLHKTVKDGYCTYCKLAMGECGDEVKWMIWVAPEADENIAPYAELEPETKYEDGTLVIFGNGEMYDYTYENPAPWNEHGSSIKHVVVEVGVTNIGDYAIFNLSELESVTVSEGVTDIGYSAVSQCYNLKSIKLPSTATSFGNFAFSYNSSLEIINIPEGTKILANGMFVGCSGLETVTVPNSVKTIDDSAFQECSSLAEIEIPVGVTELGDHAFERCTSLTSVVLPEGIETIGSSVFSRCNYLETVIFSEGLTRIGYNMFGRCSKLKTVIIPKTVTNIGSSAFWMCVGLESIIYCGTEAEWDAITKGDGWSDSASGCIMLHSYDENGICPECGVEYDGVSDKSICLHGNETNGICSGCGKAIGTLGINLFWSFEEATGILVISGEGEMFDFYPAIPWEDYSNMITEIIIEDGVTSISQRAFVYHDCVTSITIPASVTYIGDLPFRGCYELTSLIYCGTASEWETVEKSTLWNSGITAEVQFHNYKDGKCTECGLVCAHATVVSGVCSGCGMRFAMLGDVNNDGNITNADVLKIYRYIYDAALYPLDTAVADVNKDGNITNADVLKIYRYIYNSALYPLE